jgi:hypothetical protein
MDPVDDDENRAVAEDCWMHQHLRGDWEEFGFDRRSIATQAPCPQRALPGEQNR